MQTVNFNCGHCGQLVGVGAEFLGQQVRCPHCQQVIVAPPPAVPAANPEPPEFMAPPTETESIFGGPEPVGDDLFGAGPAPAIDMPTAPWLNQPVPAVSETAPLVDVEPVGAELAASTTAPAPVSPPPAPASVDGQSTTSEAELFTANMRAASALSAERMAPTRPNLALVVVLIFLAPYAVCATAAAVYFYFQKINTPHPLEAIPDFMGDHPGVTHGKGPGSVIWERPKPEQELPARDHVALHQPLTIGDLEVVPEKIERGRITIYRPRLEGRETTTLEDDGLLLTLSVRNISKDDSYYPADGYFYRQWTEDDPPGEKPYTFLQAGAERFYGGPVRWVPPGRDEPRYYVEGEENFNQILRPGETRRIVICTDPENRAVLKAVAAGNHPLQWRVQLRRGSVRYKDRDVPVSTVVAVDFSSKDIQ